MSPWLNESCMESLPYSEHEIQPWIRKMPAAPPKATIFFLISIVCSLLFSSCGSVAPKVERPDPLGLQLQRQLVQDNFTGTDVRSDAQAAADFCAGLRDSVSAAWWGFEEGDSTSSLQACLDSGARVILIPDMGKPWITQPLSLRSHTTIILQEGAEILAKSGAFRRGDDSLLGLKDAEDVALYGYGARLAMRKDDYRKAPYEKSEWRHAIELYGCARVSVLGLSVDASGGDGVYLGRGSLQSYNSDVILKDLLLKNHHRQGISVISAQDLRIENVEMSFTEGTLPSAGIDFEPNYADERILRCTLKNCIIRANAGAGVLVNLHSLDQSSPDIDIRVEDSFIFDNFLSLLVTGAGKARGRVEFLNTVLRGIQLVWPGPGLKVSGN
jgi:hypothetical protein